MQEEIGVEDLEETEEGLFPDITSLSVTAPVGALEDDQLCWTCDMCNSDVPLDSSCYTGEGLYCVCLSCYQVKKDHHNASVPAANAECLVCPALKLFGASCTLSPTDSTIAHHLNDHL